MRGEKPEAVNAALDSSPLSLDTHCQSFIILSCDENSERAADSGHFVTVLSCILEWAKYCVGFSGLQ